MKLNIPRYNFWRDGVSQSLLSTWLDCPKQCYLQYVERWTTYYKPESLIYGSCLHHCLEHIYKAGKLPNDEEINKLINEWDKANFPPETPQHILETNEFIYAKILPVIKVYFLYHAQELSWNWTHFEREFSVPYTFPDGKTTVLIGKIDLEIDNSKEIWDHKSNTFVDEEKLDLLLPVDLQVNFYLYAAYVLNQKVPERFVYNILKRPLQRRTKVAYKLDKYAEKVYDAYLAEPSKYFIRKVVPIVEDDILDWKKNFLDPVMLDVRAWYESNYTKPNYYNPKALENQFGVSPYARIIIENDYSGFYQRNKLTGF